jgi:1-acyl-sn-glycerol-3-phosphate acyltransferase
MSIANPTDPNRRSPLWLTLQPIARALFSTVFDWRVYGLENIPPTGPAILAANHQSFLDPPVVAAPLSRPVSFMAKSELFENPLFGKLIRNLHAFPIRQGRGDRGAIVETVKRLEEGYLLNIYPEGTRCEDGEIAPLLPGIALVIRKAQVPVVPTVLHGTFDAWPIHQKFFKPSPVRLAYGPALRLHDLPSAEILSVLDRVLRQMLEDLRAFPSGSCGAPLTTRVSPAPPELLA